MPKFRGGLLALTAVAVTALGVTGIADAARHRHTKRHAASTTTSTTGAQQPGSREAELTGDTATQAKAAALAAVPGGTVWRASSEDASDTSGAAYEVHVTKSDGSEVEVLEDSAFAVIATNASRQGPHGHGGPGRPGGGPNEDATHEAGESADREAQEDAGQPSTASSGASAQ